MYMVVSEAQQDNKSVPWGFQASEVTGWWFFKSSLSKETQAAEGRATTDKGSTVQIKTPEAHPIANSDAENGRQAIQDT